MLPTLVRDHLVRALEADLVGPFKGALEAGEAPAEEVLRLPPSRWYLTGFLAPAAGRLVEGPPDDEIGVGSDASSPDGDDQEPAPKRRNLLPASLGLSVLLPPPRRDQTVRATVTFAEYESEETDGGKLHWRRAVRPPVTLDVPLGSPDVALALPGTDGVWLRGRLEPAVPGDDPGTEILRPLHQAMGERGVDVDVFLNVKDKAPSTARIEEHVQRRVRASFLRAWSFGPPRPRIYYDPRTVDPAPPFASLHAKCVVVDDEVAFVGSANFTERAYKHNIETGVLVRDRGFATRLAAQWTALVAAGLVKPLPPTS